MSTAKLVAYNLYRSFGIANDNKFLKNSIVASLNTISGDKQVAYTENYFYEETIFTMYLLIEAELLYGYISSVVNMLLQNREIQEPPDFRELGMVFSEYVHFLSGERMKFAGISQIMKYDEILELSLSRSSEYAQLMNASIECSDHVEENHPHPFEIYMENVSNNISTSLGVNNSVQEMLIYQLVSTHWVSHMEVARKVSMDQA